MCSQNGIYLHVGDLLYFQTYAKVSLLGPSAKWCNQLLNGGDAGILQLWAFCTQNSRVILWWWKQFILLDPLLHLSILDLCSCISEIGREVRIHDPGTTPFQGLWQRSREVGGRLKRKHPSQSPLWPSAHSFPCQALLDGEWADPLPDAAVPRHMCRPLSQTPGRPPQPGARRTALPLLSPLCSCQTRSARLLSFCPGAGPGNQSWITLVLGSQAYNPGPLQPSSNWVACSATPASVHSHIPLHIWSSGTFLQK